MSVYFIFNPVMIEPNREIRKQNARDLTKKALQNCSHHHFKDIVYLQDDKYTYKGFLTG